jgi:DNA-binding Xre family transcriptional regulator
MSRSKRVRSIRVRPDLVTRVKLAVKQNGFLRQKDLVEAAGLADSTVRNFLGGKPVDYATFEELCQKLNLEWRDVADLGETAQPAPISAWILHPQSDNPNRQSLLNIIQSTLVLQPVGNQRRVS